MKYVLAVGSKWGDVDKLDRPIDLSNGDHVLATSFNIFEFHEDVSVWHLKKTSSHSRKKKCMDHITSIDTHVQHGYGVDLRRSSSRNQFKNLNNKTIKFLRDNWQGVENYLKRTGIKAHEKKYPNWRKMKNSSDIQARIYKSSYWELKEFISLKNAFDDLYTSKTLIGKGIWHPYITYHNDRTGASCEMATFDTWLTRDKHVKNHMGKTSNYKIFRSGADNELYITHKAIASTFIYNQHGLLFFKDHDELTDWFGDNWTQLFAAAL